MRLVYLLFITMMAVPYPAEAGKKTKAVTVSCPDGSTRPRLDCSSDMGLKERVVKTNASIPSLGLGFGGGYEERASGQITDSTYQMALSLERACKDFNACILSEADYLERTNAARTALGKHMTLTGQLQAGKPVGDQLWTNARPDLAKSRLEISYYVKAQAAGASQAVVHQSGQPLRSGDRIAFVVSPSHDAHVYLLLFSSQGEASQIFPMPEIGLTNPIPGGSQVTIPPTGSFELDDVTGTETLHLIAAKQPLADIDNRLRALKAGSPETHTAVLHQIGNLLCRDEGMDTRGLNLATTSVTCGEHQTRGMSLSNMAVGNLGEGSKLVALPNDDVIVEQHSIVHQ